MESAENLLKEIARNNIQKGEGTFFGTAYLLYNVVLTFDSVDKILVCGTVYYAVQGGSTF